jgi:hypothetical protein
VTRDATIDFNVPEAWPLDYSVSRLEYLRSVSTPPGILEEMEREATGRLVDYDADGETERWRYRFLDVKATEMAAYLLSVYRPALLTIHLLSVDDTAHDGTRSPQVKQAVAAVDGLVSYLAEVVEALGIADRTTLIVLGDHGLIDVDTLLAPNVWLVESGLGGRDRRNEPWRAAFHVKGGAAFLHLRDSGDHAAYDAVVSKIRSLRPEIRSLFEMLDRDQLQALGSDTSAVMALAAKPGTAFVGDADSVAVRATQSATHGHLPNTEGIHTGLVARGPGIRRGGRLDQIRLTDVAPLVAYLLGLDFDTPDGVLPVGIIEKRDQSR